MKKGTYPDLAGKTSVVTGGAVGIGEACVRALVEQRIELRARLAHFHSSHPAKALCFPWTYLGRGW
jgi:NAD(P)-dependent dehydrogenase (short-subunit alcohol dehydrogenase family)